MRELIAAIIVIVAYLLIGSFTSGFAYADRSKYCERVPSHDCMEEYNSMHVLKGVFWPAYLPARIAIEVFK